MNPKLQLNLIAVLLKHTDSMDTIQSSQTPKIFNTIRNSPLRTPNVGKTISVRGGSKTRKNKKVKRRKTGRKKTSLPKSKKKIKKVKKTRRNKTKIKK